MAIDETPAGTSKNLMEGSSAKFVVVFVILVALAIAQIYSLSQLTTLRGSFETQQEKLRKDLSAQLQDQLSSRLSAFEHSNAQQLDAMKTEVDTAAKRMGRAGGEIRRSKEKLAKLETEQNQQAEALKQEIARKADQQQLGALTQDVSATKTDLDTTKKAVDTLRSDLGMARSELGTLIAKNHDDIDTLRKLGERDYFEFTLERNQPQTIVGVSVLLKRTNLKRHRFSVNLVADDQEIEKKDRTVNEPIFFYVGGSKRAYELVVNKVQSNKVTGYVSTPKGVVQTASRSEGAR